MNIWESLRASAGYGEARAARHHAVRHIANTELLFHEHQGTFIRDAEEQVVVAMRTSKLLADCRQVAEDLRWTAMLFSGPMRNF